MNADILKRVVRAIAEGSLADLDRLAPKLVEAERKEIERLLKLTLSAVRVAEPIAWDRLVKDLQGASAAMVVKAAQNAAKAAVLVGNKEVTQSVLDEAVAELKRTDLLSSKEQ